MLPVMAEETREGRWESRSVQTWMSAEMGQHLTREKGITAARGEAGTVLQATTSAVALQAASNTTGPRWARDQPWVAG